MKTCATCQHLKSKDDFYPEKRKKGSGFTSSCKECCRMLAKEQTKKHVKRQKEYLEKNKTHIALKTKQYYENNKEKIKEYAKVNRKTRYREDLLFKIKTDLRCRTGQALRENHKSGSAIRDLGCSISELKVYLESKFQPGMTWDNWSRNGWHIDHIRPLSKFDLTNRKQFLEACHYTNLQPLWSKDNIKKSNKI